jgi:beta-galactosidase
MLRSGSTASWWRNGLTTIQPSPSISPRISPSGENVLAVRAANIGRNSHWYSSSGIYRHVWMNIVRAARFEQSGLTITTPTITADAASIHVAARTVNAAPGSAITTRIRDAAGNIVAEGTSAVGTPALLQVNRPRLWSPERPALYQVECLLISEGKTLDRMTAPLGIRKIEIDAVNGLRLNGKPYKLRGGCIDHDNFIADAPHEDAGMVSAAPHHGGEVLFPPAIEIGTVIVRVLADPPHVEAFFHDKHAQPDAGQRGESRWAGD